MTSTEDMREGSEINKKKRSRSDDLEKVENSPFEPPKKQARVIPQQNSKLPNTQSSENKQALSLEEEQENEDDEEENEEKQNSFALDSLRTLAGVTDESELKSQLYELLYIHDINLADAINEEGDSILHWAASSDNLNLKLLNLIAQLFENKGVDIDIERLDGMTSLGLAIQQGLECQAQLLMHFGADPNYYNEETGRPGVGEFDKQQIDLQPKDLEEIQSIEKQLIDAFHPGNVMTVVNEFFQTGNDAQNKKLNACNDTLLHIAISRGFIKPDLKKILKLCSTSTEVKNIWGYTPIMTAVSSQNLTAVKLLLKHNGHNNPDKLLELAFDGKNDQIFTLIYENTDDAFYSREMTTRYHQIKNLEQRRHRRVNYLKTLSPFALYLFCKEHEEFELVVDPPCPLFTNTINQKQAVLWINNHPLEQQGLAKKIIENINHVSFEEFKAQLKICVESFNDQLLYYPTRARRYVLVLPELTGKSNPWVFSHALKFFNILPEKVVRINDLSTYLENCDTDETINLVFMDDASYSGTQMKYDLDLANYAASETNANIRVHCLIPFMTKRAHELLSSHNETFFGHFKIIPSIQHLFNDTEKEILQDNNINSQDPEKRVHINWPEMTLTYFDHKIADWKSTFSTILKQGRTINNYNCKIPFVPFTIEPYKKEITIPAELAWSFRGDEYQEGLPKQQGSHIKEKERQRVFTPFKDIPNQSSKLKVDEKAGYSVPSCIIS